MEKNTVVIDLNTYNELRDFKNKIMEVGNEYTIQLIGNSTIKILSNDETIKQISKTNEEISSNYINISEKKLKLHLENTEYEIKNNLLEVKIDELKLKIEILNQEKNNIRKMSIWEFVKWR